MPVPILRPRIRPGSPAARTRAQISVDARRGADAGHLATLRRQMEYEMALEYIRELVAGWPPFTDEQKSVLAAVFE